MCGIFGYVGKNLQEIDSEKIIKVLKHRGPDDDGIYQNEDVLLIHLRLSILDLSSNGHQPMVTEDGGFIICFNGEIYNHMELRQELIATHDVKFKSDSDTETLLLGYKYWGKGLLNKLNGIFSFIIYNKHNNKLFVARDHFGVKPLYIYQNDNAIAFSSELKAFEDLPDFNAEINKVSFINYLSFLWSPGKTTPFKNVNKILPGHYIEVDCKTGHSKVEQYYELPFSGEYSKKSENELIDLLDLKLQKAVQRQLLSDVPVSFFLSGGLDSSLLVAIARKHFIKDKITAYTIDTTSLASKEGFANDLTYAKQVAKALDIDLKIVTAEAEIVRDFDEMIYHLDEPQADAAPLNVLNICKQASKDGFKVMIGGTAGDDVFSGYRRHKALAIEKYLRFIPMVVKKLIKKSVYKLNADKPFLRRIRKILGEIDLPVYERIANYYSWIPLNELKLLFKDRIEPQNYPSTYLINLLNEIPKEQSLLNQMLFWELKTFLVDHNLNYTDKMSMAAGVEVRVPFLDIELVEFACTIPPEFKLKSGQTKYILKKVAERYLPKDVIYRPKAGFGAPVRSWITNDLELRIQSSLSEDSINKRGIFNYKAVQKLLDDNRSGKIDASYVIFGLLAIEAWFKLNVDRQA